MRAVLAEHFLAHTAIEPATGDGRSIFYKQQTQPIQTSVGETLEPAAVFLVRSLAIQFGWNAPVVHTSSTTGRTMGRRPISFVVKLSRAVRIFFAIAEAGAPFLISLRTASCARRISSSFSRM